MDGVALLKQAASVGLSVRADGDKLVIRGPRKAEQVVRLLTEHKPAVLATINADGANLPQGDFTTDQAANLPLAPAIDEERAAIVEYDAGVPRSWATGFAKLSTMSRPAGMSLRARPPLQRLQLPLLLTKEEPKASQCRTHQNDGSRLGNRICLLLRRDGEVSKQL